MKSCPPIFKYLLAILVIGHLGCIEKDTKSSTIDTQLQPLVFSPDFPNILPLPDHLPKGELIMGNTENGKPGHVFYSFDEQGKFIRNFTIDEYSNLNKNASINLPKNVESGKIMINKLNLAEKRIIFKKFEINLPENKIVEAHYVDANYLNLDPILDPKSDKYQSFELNNRIIIYNKNHKQIFVKNLRQLYDYKQNFIRNLEDDGADLLVNVTDQIYISSFYDCNEGYESVCDFKVLKFEDGSKNYIVKIDPFINDSIKENYQALSPKEIRITDNTIRLFFDNSPKILRVVIDPYNKIVYNKEFDLNTFMDVKYKSIKEWPSFFEENFSKQKKEFWKEYSFKKL